MRAISLSDRLCRCGAGGSARTASGRVGAAAGDGLSDVDERGRGGGNRDAGEIERCRDNEAHLLGGAGANSLLVPPIVYEMGSLVCHGLMVYGRTSTRVLSFLLNPRTRHSCWRSIRSENARALGIMDG